MSINREKITNYIYKAHKKILEIRGIERSYEEELLKSIGSKPLKIIIGFRRSGKSFLIQRLLKKLVDLNKYDIDNILYLNFESHELSSINSVDKLDEVYQIFQSFISENKGPKILAFDEIQKIEDWDKFIRSIYEFKDENLEIIISGSNSDMLSSELGSNLAGRFIEYKIEPFSFKEFAQYRELNISCEKDFIKNKDELEKLFYEYMQFGGLPEVFTINDDQAKYSYIDGILSKVILDDIIQRFKLRNSYILELLIKYLFANPANIISFSKIKKHLRNLGYEINENTLIDYVQYCIKTFAIYEISKFDWKSKKIFSSSRKYCSVDLGLVNLHQDLMKSFGKQLENLIYLELLRNKNIKNIYYGSDNYKEIDFITQDRKENLNKYQICKTLNEENQDRELGSFVSSDKYLNSGKNILLTLDTEEGEIEYKNSTIYRQNIIKWLLLGESYA